MRTISSPSLLSLIAAGVITTSAHAATVPVVILGTNDVHGRVERLASYAAHVKLVRDEVAAEGGGVVVLDAGDMFQGTLESNLNEGAVVVKAYNAMGITAVAIGNHEFDYGPIGPRVTVKSPEDDPRGALKARIHEAHYPFLAANVIDDVTGKPIAWDNVKPSMLVHAGPVLVGVIGISTPDTAHTTIAANFKGLHTAAIAPTIEREAKALRAQGAQIVVVTAHAGSSCSKLDDANDPSSCDDKGEIMGAAKALPRGLVDVIVAGHTHAPMAHVVNGIAIIESFANGRAFGRVDFVVDTTTHAVTLAHLPRPHMLCTSDEKAPIAACKPADYDGKPVVLDKDVLAIVEPAVAASKDVKERKLGVKVLHSVWRRYDDESALGNLFADLMLRVRSDADVSLMNGGGIRTDLPEGDLTYGQVFEMIPFDNRYATVKLTAAELSHVLDVNLSVHGGGILSIAGVDVVTHCAAGHAHTTLWRKGKPLDADAPMTLATTDFMVLGGDHALSTLPKLESRMTLDDGEPVRESLVKALETQGGTLDGKDRALFDKAHPRMKNDAANGIGRCPAPAGEAP
jgi:5'-nucleotidase